jgi:hypothetical protein
VLETVITVGGLIGGITVDPIEFPPGSVELDAAGAARLEGLAELMRSRPRLELELRGLAASTEREALARAALRARLEGIGAASYEAALAQQYREQLGEAPPGDAPSVAAMEAALLEGMEVTPADLARVARERAAGVKERLVGQGVSPTRLFVPSEPQPVVEAPRGRVEFELLT